MIYEAYRPNEMTEAQRLSLLCDAYDPISVGRLARVDLRPGARCADLGAGTGTIARHLAERVGRQGSVTAVDLVPYEPPEGIPQLRRVTGDITGDGLPAGAHDLLYARAVLHFLPRREALLRRLAARLRPGGTLAIETFDFGLVAGDPTPLGAAWRLLVEAGGRGGIALEWAVDLAATLEGASLDVVVAETTIPLAAVAAPGRRYWVQSLRLARPFLVREPGGAAIVDAATEHLTVASGAVRLPALTAVFGRAAP